MTSRNYAEEEVQALTDRVFLLKERLQAGKMLFAADVVDDFRRSFAAIRLRPDGKVDPTTVDSRIRASTLAVVAMKQREEAKEALSLAQIQEAYFALLFREFGWLFEQMSQAGANPSQAARIAAQNSGLVRSLIEALPAIAERLREFWDTVGDSAAYHLQDGPQLKATFSGDLFPAHWENAVSTAGLYVDTISLPCPITRISSLLGMLPSQALAERLIKHTLTAMTYRDLAVADLDPPIALVIPNPIDVDKGGREGLFQRSQRMTLKHGEYLFGRSFESVEHLKDLCDGLLTVDEVLKEASGADRIMLDAEWGRDPREQLSRTVADSNPIMPGLDRSVAGHHVLAACLGRIPQAVAAQENAFHFGGTPLINAETSWLYYTWLMEYEGTPAPLDRDNRQSMHVVRALVSEGDNNLQWLGNVPPETVLEIRKRGLAEEVRQLLGHGVKDLIGIDSDNYFRTADQVVENLDRAFREHQRSLLEAKHKKLKFYGLDVGSCVATGGVAIAAALTGSTTLATVSGVMGLAGFPTLKDIKTKFKEIAAEEEARRASPTGLLFKHVRRR